MNPRFTALLLFFFIFNLASPCYSDRQLKKSEESIKDLIMKLNKEYDTIGEKLKDLKKGIRRFPDTTLNIFVSKQGAGLKLISVNIADNSVLFKSHIYTGLENRAMSAGGHHQLYQGEIGEGVHTLQVEYIWAGGKEKPKKGQTQFTISVKPAVNYFLGLALRKRGDKVNLFPYQFEYFSR